MVEDTQQKQDMVVPSLRCPPSPLTVFSFFPCISFSFRFATPFSLLGAVPSRVWHCFFCTDFTPAHPLLLTSRRAAGRFRSRTSRLLLPLGSKRSPPPQAAVQPCQGRYTVGVWTLLQQPQLHNCSCLLLQQRGKGLSSRPLVRLSSLWGDQHTITTAAPALPVLFRFSVADPF